MKTLDKRNETYGLDVKITPDMACRTEVMANTDQGTGVSMQELINVVCDLLDGEDVVDIFRNTGLDEESCKRIDEIRNKVRPLWTYADGRKVIG